MKVTDLQVNFLKGLFCVYVCIYLLSRFRLNAAFDSGQSQTDHQPCHSGLVEDCGDIEQVNTFSEREKLAIQYTRVIS